MARVRAARPGETGEVVVTDLHNLACPMIRYVNGDLAVARDDDALRVWPGAGPDRTGAGSHHRDHVRRPGQPGRWARVQHPVLVDRPRRAGVPGRPAQGSQRRVQGRPVARHGDCPSARSSSSARTSRSYLPGRAVHDRDRRRHPAERRRASGGSSWSRSRLTALALAAGERKLILRARAARRPDRLSRQRKDDAGQPAARAGGARPSGRDGAEARRDRQRARRGRHRWRAARRRHRAADRAAGRLRVLRAGRRARTHADRARRREPRPRGDRARDHRGRRAAADRVGGAA